MENTGGENVLGMSDDDFLKTSPPVVTEEPEKAPTVVAEEEESEEEETKDPVEESEEEEEPEELTEAEKKAAAETEEEEEEEKPDPTDEEALKSKAPAKVKAEETPQKKTDPVETKEKKDVGTVATTETPLDYKALYEQLMTPFKANGKTIELKDPKELIQLAQMGANYTRKMQDLVPHRKALLMLENNGLLDEGKLSYLIDLDKKNPEAIKKLIKEAGIDPMDIDVEATPAYKEGAHRVSDADVSFNTALDSLSASDEGKATLVAINQWDEVSKQRLFKDPGIMDAVHEQRTNGVYDKISTEIERQRTLGTIPAGVPFLEAYRQVGDFMVANHMFDDLVTKEPEQKTQVQATPVVKRAATPKPQVSNDARAKAASTTKSSSRPAKTAVNPLSMSDEDFLKQFENRL